VTHFSRLIEGTDKTQR